jgi:ribonuclease HII
VSSGRAPSPAPLCARCGAVAAVPDRFTALSGIPDKKLNMREERVQYCMTMMRERRWVQTTAFRSAVAAEMQVSSTTLEDIAAEAWRRVQREIANKPALQTFAIQTLQDAASMSMQAAETARRPGDERRVAVAAAAELLRWSAVQETPQDWERLSVAEKWARLDEYQERLDGLRAQLPARGDAVLGEGGDGG